LIHDGFAGGTNPFGHARLREMEFPPNLLNSMRPI
jgi:hypothetical protein